MVALRIRDRRFAINDGLEEVAEVVGQRSILIDLLERTIWQRIRSKLLDRSANEAAPVDKDASFRAFKKNAVVRCRVGSSTPIRLQTRP